jgi:hypothetical protein
LVAKAVNSHVEKRNEKEIKYKGDLNSQKEKNERSRLVFLLEQLVPLLQRVLGLQT